MALWDSIGSLFGAAGSIYDIYQGIKSNQQAQQYLNLTAGTAAKQDQYTDLMMDQFKKYIPYEDLNLQYMMQDLQTLRPAYEDQIGYQVQRLGEELQLARQLNPTLDNTKRNVVNTLTKDSSQLRSEMMGQATTDVSLAYGNQRAQDTRNMGLAGINPNSGQFSNYMNRMGQSEALANASARTTSARQAEDLALSRQAAALNYASGAQLPTYGYTQSVDPNSVTSGLASSAGSYTGLANMANNNAQNAFSGFGYLANQLSNGAFGQMGTNRGY